MNSSDRKGLRTWIEIDTKALSHNYSVLRDLVPEKTIIMSVVKSNAYGHGLTEFALEVQKLGADWFGVDSMVEAIALRDAGITKPILVLGYTLPEMLTKAVESDVSVAVSTFELFDVIRNSAFSKKIKVHVKVDTGMHRQGFQEYEIDRVLKTLKELESKIIVEGLFSHFAGVKNSQFSDFTQKQLESFKTWVRDFERAGLMPIVHVSASSGALVLPGTSFDMVRFGIAMYGIWPSEDIQRSLSATLQLMQVLEWKTLVSEIKKVSKGERIGYDFTEELQKDSVIAICPIGYWHGFPRSLSGAGEVLVCGKKARVLGRVSMDMIIVDITDIQEVKVGDVVTIIGMDGSESISADYVARLAGTSAYEVITRINPLIKRFYI